MPYEQECASGLHWQLAQLPSSPEFARSWAVAATSRSGMAGSKCFHFEANKLTCISGVRRQLVSLHVRRGDNVPSQVLPLSPDTHGAIPLTRPLSNVSILCSENSSRRVSLCGPFAVIPQVGSPAEQTDHDPQRPAIYQDWREEAPELYGTPGDSEAPHLTLTPGPHKASKYSYSPQRDPARCARLLLTFLVDSSKAGGGAMCMQRCRASLVRTSCRSAARASRWPFQISYTRYCGYASCPRFRIPPVQH
jgi:hypothetical protein